MPCAWLLCILFTLFRFFISRVVALKKTSYLLRDAYFDVKCFLNINDLLNFFVALVGLQNIILLPIQCFHTMCFLDLIKLSDFYWQKSDKITKCLNDIYVLPLHFLAVVALKTKILFCCPVPWILYVLCFLNVNEISN